VGFEAWIAHKKGCFDFDEAPRVYKELAGAFNEVVSEQKKIFGWKAQTHGVVSRATCGIWQSSKALLCASLGLIGPQVSADFRFPCREIMQPNFLQSLKRADGESLLFRSLLEDQVQALREYAAAPVRQRPKLEPCVRHRWGHLEELLKNYSQEHLSEAGLQVLAGRMRLLQGRDDAAVTHFRIALRLDSRHAEAIYYSAQRAQAKGEREQERRLLQGLVTADFEKYPHMRELFDQSFERLATLVTLSEALKLVDGPWKKLDKSSLRRVRRGLEAAEASKDTKKMETYFTDAFGPGDLGRAPDWAYLAKARYFLHKGELSRAFEHFDRAFLVSEALEVDEFRRNESWFELAFANESFVFLRKWAQRVLEQRWARELPASQRAKIERYFVSSLEGGAIDPQNPIQDLTQAQRLLPHAQEIVLLSIEVLLSQRAPLRPEGAFANRNTAFARARSSARFLQASGKHAAEAAYWEMWMDWGLGNLRSARSKGDVVLRELQRGKGFHNPISLQRYWEISRELHQRLNLLPDYRSKLARLIGDAEAQESVRQAAQSELQALGK
jgi:tetratricopeptide (TPR) repeat protein